MLHTESDRQRNKKARKERKNKEYIYRKPEEETKTVSATYPIIVIEVR
jgi:hypothetical protein